MLQIWVQISCSFQPLCWQWLHLCIWVQPSRNRYECYWWFNYTTILPAITNIQCKIHTFGKNATVRIVIPANQRFVSNELNTLLIDLNFFFYFLLSSCFVCIGLPWVGWRQHHSGKRRYTKCNRWGRLSKRYSHTNSISTTVGNMRSTWCNHNGK